MGYFHVEYLGVEFSNLLYNGRGNRRVGARRIRIGIGRMESDGEREGDAGWVLSDGRNAREGTTLVQAGKKKADRMFLCSAVVGHFWGGGRDKGGPLRVGNVVEK